MIAVESLCSRSKLTDTVILMANHTVISGHRKAGERGDVVVGSTDGYCNTHADQHQVIFWRGFPLTESISCISR